MTRVILVLLLAFCGGVFAGDFSAVETKLQAAMPDRFESADDAVGLMYADTTGTRPTRTQISAAVRQHALRATARHALEHCVCRAPSGCFR